MLYEKRLESVVTILTASLGVTICMSAYFFRSRRCLSPEMAILPMSGVLFLKRRLYEPETAGFRNSPALADWHDQTQTLPLSLKQLPIL